MCDSVFGCTRGAITRRKAKNRRDDMPENGESNTRFGVYKNLCCGVEVIVAEGMEFPDCPNHPRLTTIWKPANTDTIHKLSMKQAKSDKAA